MTQIRRLFTFVDFKDPFMEGEIADEPQAGPILSMMSANQFRYLVLLYTPHLVRNAIRTRNEVQRRYPECAVEIHQLNVSNPRDHSSLMANLAPLMRELMQQTEGERNYVCLSSGTAAMQAVWLLLKAAGELPARLVQSPSQPLLVEPGTMGLQFDVDTGQAASHMLPAARPSKSSGWGFFSKAVEQAKGGDEVVFDALAGAGLREADGSHTLRVGACKDRFFGTGQPPELDNALAELEFFVGSATIREAVERAAIVAHTALPVLLLGETGTGKDKFAQLIHRLSPRSQREWVAINCAAIPKEIAESYLFGHVKGSFTGANSDRKGVFEDSDQTTLFLDEIAELSLEVQAKLLRVLDSGFIQRVGSTMPRKVDVRIIAATNKNLQDEVTEGRFREDLFFRLEVLQIRLPSLRERQSEIAGLAAALLNKINLKRKVPRQLSKDALRRLEQYDWPGNVRQLTNVLERSVLYSRTDILMPDDLLISDNRPAKDPFASLPEPCDGFSLDLYLTQVRKQLIMRALSLSAGNQSEAAKLLGVSRQAISKFLAGEAVSAS